MLVEILPACIAGGHRSLSQHEDLLRAHHHGVLLKPKLERPAVLGPPALVQRFHHDFVNDQIVAHRPARAFLPKAADRRPRGRRSIRRSVPLADHAARDRPRLRSAPRSCHKAAGGFAPNTCELRCARLPALDWNCALMPSRCPHPRAIVVEDLHGSVFFQRRLDLARITHCDQL